MTVVTHENLNSDGREVTFWKELAESTGRIMELGTRRSQSNRSTHHKAQHPDGDWTLVDFADGLDVDVVSDAHRLVFDDETFDFIVAASVYEHLERPWVAVEEARRVLKPGGQILIVTHQTFPIHGYPSDFWRFTDKAFTDVLFDGWSESHAWYEFPVKIVVPPVVKVWNEAAPAFLNVCGWAKK